MAQQTITESEEGKRVVGADGERIGIVSRVRAGTAYIDPDPGITETVRSKLGSADIDEDAYPLTRGDIDHITDDEIVLRRSI